MRIVIASASGTLNDHIGQPSPIDPYNEFGLTGGVTENRRVNGVALKCHRVVSRRLYEAPLWVAFDNAQKEILRSALCVALFGDHAPHPCSERIERHTCPSVWVRKAPAALSGSESVVHSKGLLKVLPELGRPDLPRLARQLKDRKS